MKFLRAAACRIVEILGTPLFFRRAILVSALVYFGVLGWKVLEPSVLILMSAPGATLAGGVFTLLTGIITLYQWLRDRDEKREAELEKLKREEKSDHD